MVSKGRRPRKEKTKRKKTKPRGREIRRRRIELAYGIYPTTPNPPGGQGLGDIHSLNRYHQPSTQPPAPVKPRISHATTVHEEPKLDVTGWAVRMIQGPGPFSRIYRLLDERRNHVKRFDSREDLAEYLAGKTGMDYNYLVNYFYEMLAYVFPPYTLDLTNIRERVSA